MRTIIVETPEIEKEAEILAQSKLYADGIHRIPAKKPTEYCKQQKYRSGRMKTFQYSPKSELFQARIRRLKAKIAERG